MPRLNLIRLRRGTTAQWTSADPTLSAGEPGYDLDTGTFKIGDGVSPWSILATLATPSGSSVTSVNGKTGVVTLVPGDIGAVPTTRTIAGLDLSANRDATAIRGALGTGTPSSLNFLRGDGIWAVPSGGGGPSLDVAGGAVGIDATADSPIASVSAGDMWMAAGGVVANVADGGVIRDIQSLQVTWDSANITGASPATLDVGTALNVQWSGNVNQTGYNGVQGSAFGPAGIINIGGDLAWESNQNFAAFDPVAALDYLVIRNKAGVARTMVPTWTYISARAHIADGATVTLAANDTNSGGAAFVDTPVYMSRNTGLMDGTTNINDLTHFYAGGALLGHVQMSRRVGYDVASILLGSDPYMGGPGTIADATPAYMGTPDTENVTLNEQIGLRIAELQHATRNLGIQNASGTHEVAKAVTLSGASSTITRDATVVHLTCSSNLTLTATPVMSSGLDGQRVSLVNVGAYVVTIPSGTSGFAQRIRLAPGDTATVTWETDTWRLLASSETAIERDQWYKDSAGGTSGAKVSSLGVGAFNNITDANPVLTMGQVFGIPFLSWGAGGASAPDAYLGRSAAGVLDFGATLGASDGNLKLGRVNFKNYASAASIANPHTAGEYAVIGSRLHVCTASGSPGTWKPVAVTPASGGLETLSTNSAATGATTLNITNGNVHVVTMTGNVTFTFSGATASQGCSFTLELRQDSTGSRTVTWPGAVDWPSGTAPTLSTAANAVDVLTFYTTDGGTTWRGFLSGKGMA